MLSILNLSIVVFMQIFLSNIHKKLLFVLYFSKIIRRFSVQYQEYFDIRNFRAKQNM